MKVIVAAATLSLVLAGCANSADREGQGTADCAQQIRMDGVIYTGAGYTNHEAAKFGTADRAECHDVGPDATGIVFPENPQQVDVWSFAEYSPDEVLAVRFDQDYAFAVFVNVSVPQSRADAIVRELSQFGEQRHEEPRDLWGDTFFSVNVTEGGEHRPLASNNPIELRFALRDVREGMTWEAGCNIHGANVEITANRLVLKTISATEVGCPRELLEQDEWLANFFDSDPHWELDGDQMAVTSGETVIQLKRVASTVTSP